MSDSTTPQDSAAMSPASTGSVAGEPVAWFVDGVGYPYATVIRERAQAWADSDGGVIVPLYRQPPCQEFSQQNLTLTGAEREALEWASKKMRLLGDAYDPERAATLRRLLERLGGGR